MLNHLLSSLSKKKDAKSSETSANNESGETRTSNSDSSLKKVVIITGGSSGIGKATAVEFARIGYRVAITGRNKDKLKSVWQKMMDASTDHRSEDYLVLQADFEDIKQVETTIEAVLKAFGRLDILVNNAGYQAKNRGIKDSDFFEDFLKIQQVNLHAPMRLCQLAVPHLVETKGVIINVTSIADRIPMETISYSVSKAGLSMMTKCLANALEGKQVRVVGVAPGPVKTNFAVGMELAGFMTSMGRVGDSKELADTIVFLASDKASFIHGTIVTVDGGCQALCGGAFRQPKFLSLFT